MKLNKLVSTLNMDHETWLQYRKKGIGGSDAGSICGLNPYSTAISVFQDKTQLQAEEKADNEASARAVTWRNMWQEDLQKKPERRSVEQMQSFTKRSSHLCWPM